MPTARTRCSSRIVFSVVAVSLPSSGMTLTTNRMMLRAMPGIALGLRSRFQSRSTDSRTQPTSSRAKESPHRSASSATFVTGK
ncbi:hypothetical protein [Streptomyces mirabilis]|uniref:hypothetical protein n=1 Tax=Streptomyces mirabilis TaxID=68239 RepID=UPI003653C636